MSILLIRTVEATWPASRSLRSGISLSLRLRPPFLACHDRSRPEHRTCSSMIRFEAWLESVVCLRNHVPAQPQGQSNWCRCTFYSQPPAPAKPRPCSAVPRQGWLEACCTQPLNGSPLFAEGLMIVPQLNPTTVRHARWPVAWTMTLPPSSSESRDCIR